MKVPSKEKPNISPNGYKPDDLSMKNKQLNEPYIAAELSRIYVDSHPSFTIGTGQCCNDKQTGFLYAELKEGSNYTVFNRT